MKKFISYAILFLALPAVLGAAWTAFVVVADYRSYTGALAAPPETTVAVCGDSQTKDALDPALVPGLFNFSTAATTCDQDFLRLADLLVANRGRFKYVLLDVSEFGGSSCYLDQESSLQDEIADKIAAAYALGFRFCYFDGSEGTNAPFAYHVPMAQYRVWKKLSPSPLFTEGAAKAHFSWHHLDIFPPAIFKEMIRRYPAEEAPRMREDFTRINFGWWGFWTPDGREDGGTQPDLIEYGTSRAAAWDCPVTIQMRLDTLQKHPRKQDILEVFRRWEDVRARRWLTEEQKMTLRDLSQEHILLLNGNGEYELTPYEALPVPQRRLRVYLFSRGEQQCAVYWHTDGEGTLRLPLAHEVSIRREIDGEELPCTRADCEWRIPVGGRAYLITNAEREVLAEAFRSASLE